MVPRGVGGGGAASSRVSDEGPEARVTQPRVARQDSDPGCCFPSPRWGTQGSPHLTPDLTRTAGAHRAPPPAPVLTRTAERARVPGWRGIPGEVPTPPLVRHSAPCHLPPRPHFTPPPRPPRHLLARCRIPAMIRAWGGPQGPRPVCLVCVWGGGSGRKPGQRAQCAAWLGTGLWPRAACQVSRLRPQRS